jgi:hypothetical protein
LIGRTRLDDLIRAVADDVVEIARAVRARAASAFFAAGVAEVERRVGGHVALLRRVRSTVEIVESVRSAGRGHDASAQDEEKAFHASHFDTMALGRGT